MQDSFQLPSNDNDNWLMYPGAKIESACQLTDSALLFAGSLSARIVVMVVTVAVAVMMLVMMMIMTITLIIA